MARYVGARDARSLSLSLSLIALNLSRFETLSVMSACLQRPSEFARSFGSFIRITNETSLAASSSRLYLKISALFSYPRWGKKCERITLRVRRKQTGAVTRRRRASCFCFLTSRERAYGTFFRRTTRPCNEIKRGIGCTVRRRSKKRGYQPFGVKLHRGEFGRFFFRKAIIQSDPSRSKCAVKVSALRNRRCFQRKLPKCGNILFSQKTLLNR